MHQAIQQTLIQAGQNTLLFQDVMRTIREHYECTPCAFETGYGTDRPIKNAAGSNAASCLLLAFARRLNLDEQTTLALYGEHFRAVLAEPEGSAHANIRAFIAAGWKGVHFSADPLRLKGPG